jgi:AcrR family transcriptional regulator
MKKPISEATRSAVLDAAWKLLASRRGDATMAEIAAAADVSRQTLFYAFGNRAGLLVALVRHRDAQGDQVARLSELARGTGDDEAALLAFLRTWLEYLPQVYPVAIRLECEAIGDPDALAAWNDRFNSLRRGFELILGRMAAARHLRRGANPVELAGLCFSLVLPSTWRHLVVESGWSPAAYERSRLELVRCALGSRPERSAAAG